MNPDHETISALRIHLLDDCGTEHPSPANATHSAWIPQTIGDQIWVIYQFQTAADRKTWEKSISQKLKHCLDRSLIQNALAVVDLQHLDPISSQKPQ